MNAKFITFEGGEGAGKSTQVNLLSDFLKRLGKEVITTREPGGSEGGEAIRKILVEGDVRRWDPMTEAMLFFAARRDHVVNKILPALNKGIWVISDRFADSTLAYQCSGYKRGISREEYLKIYELAIGEFKPDITFILDLPPEIGLERAFNRNPDKSRFEKMDINFHHNLRTAFLKIAEDEPKRCSVINANAETEVVKSQITKEIEKRFKAFL